MPPDYGWPLRHKAPEHLVRRRRSIPPDTLAVPATGYKSAQDIVTALLANDPEAATCGACMTVVLTLPEALRAEVEALMG